MAQVPSPAPSPAPTPTPSVKQGEVKEFVMQSYYSPEQKRPFFSLSEMVVKKGDLVRVKVTNTFGMHDFVIDEFDVKRETPLSEEQVIEFTASKAGEFVYYCSKPGHRAAGQWGTLKVVE
jgi:heme/copper-type cytochrome/quinol oxidase subunit 2